MSSDRPVYQTQLEAYRAEYGSFIRRELDLGPLALIELGQTRGDFSDPVTGDLHLLRVLSRAYSCIDLGAGKSSGWWPPASMGVTAAGYANTIVVDQAHRLDAVCVKGKALGALDIEGHLPADLDFGAAHWGMHSDPVLGSAIDALWLLCPDADIVAVESALALIASRLVLWSGRVPKSVTKESLSPFHLRLAQDRLRSLGTDRTTLSEVAALCGYSPFHFCRAFKAVTGLTPSRYQTMCRIERAKDLLQSSSLSISDIAETVGFTDTSYFARVFAREAGWSPQRWRLHFRSAGTNEAVLNLLEI
ncbi:helix-turn-helix transcriptional regulator (plasmid) [Rhizobium sp. WL3]|uniref:helix-turn-helix transcriptional regulator n=1 Tax=Rhizobium sp. WL3 TaxID=2603277 RepID=UPI0011C20514|nr:AraC family transcriptional regulator [Rhizobium sp. WL3]QEE43477.1 helix-turn-helix transcriptional regulator [Rhizobium sp. WL3]